MRLRRAEYSTFRCRKWGFEATNEIEDEELYPRDGSLASLLSVRGDRNDSEVGQKALDLEGLFVPFGKSLVVCQAEFALEGYSGIVSVGEWYVRFTFVSALGNLGVFGFNAVGEFAVN